MPELPEVQTIVDDLNKKIKGYRIVGFWTDWRKAIKPSLIKFKREIVGCRTKNVKRRGKNILVYLDTENAKCRDATCRVSTEKVMLIHLKMTGHLLIKIPNYKSQITKNNDYFSEKVNQYIHHIWTLQKGETKKTLEFSDLRKFGKIELLKNHEVDKSLNKLGIEPLDKEFTKEKLAEILEKKQKSIIRNVLLNQNLIAGIGNIYVSEILFETGISPERLAGKINKKEIEKLYKNIKKVLQKAIKLRGTSDSDYRDTAGAPGGFQKVLKVYNRERRGCKKCGNEIQRKKINQRSAYFCDNCQN